MRITFTCLLIIFISGCGITKMYNEAKIKRSIVDYEYFIKAHPNNKLTKQAKDELAALYQEKEAWEKAKSINNPKAYEEFISKNPESIFLEDAKRNKLELEDNAAWQEAKNSMNKSIYEKYLSSFPSGKYRIQAEKAIVDLEVDGILKGNYGQLPTMERSNSGNNKTTTTKVSIFNNTEYNLTIWYSGTAESKKIIINPQHTETFTLSNGEYRVAASVDADRVRNYAGNEKLEGGECGSKFYIRRGFTPGF